MSSTVACSRTYLIFDEGTTYQKRLTVVCFPPLHIFRPHFFFLLSRCWLVFLPLRTEHLTSRISNSSDGPLTLCNASCGNGTFQEHSPSKTLLVLDLGHIAFRRDDTAAVRREGGQSVQSPPRAAAPADALLAAAALPVFSSDTENGTASAAVGGVFGPRMIVDDPPVMVEDLGDVAQSDWRLDVSGVQVRRNRPCGGTGRAVEYFMRWKKSMRGNGHCGRIGLAAEQAYYFS